MSEDRNFDPLVTRLEKRVYGSVKGKLRLEMVWDDIRANLDIDRKKMKILDAGGGFGKISSKLAKRGHDIVLCDISEKMLEKAAYTFEENYVKDKLTLMHSPFQDLPKEMLASFDIILFHAVLEWLTEPLSSLKILLKYLKPGGHLSLLFYNATAFLFYNALKGNFHKISSGDYKGHVSGLTPMNPMDPTVVEEFLEENGIRQISKTGIRVFYDYMRPDIQKNRSLQDILEIEKKYCRKEPYVSMGRYIHTIGRAD